MNAALIAKVKHLLALAKNNTNEHEAQAAMAAVTKLVEQYRLSMAEIENATSSGESVLVDDEPLAYGGKIAIWQQRLIVYLCDFHGCVAWSYRCVLDDDTVEKRISIVGRATDIAVVREMYTFCVLELTRIARKRKLPRHVANSWYLGAAHGIRDSLEAAQKAARGEATTTAIVLVDTRQQQASEVMRQRMPDIRDSKVRNSEVGSASAYFRGMADGRSVEMSRRTQLEPTRHPAQGEQMNIGFGDGKRYDRARSGRP